MPPRSSGSVDRFQVMGVLQAARALALGLDPEAAKSWGLNRAIFYTALRKRYIRRGRPTSATLHARQRGHPRPPFFSVGGEKAYRSPDESHGLRFMIGGRAQTPDQFDRQIRARFANWHEVWSEALRIVDQARERDLMSAGRFYRNVYKPRRDELVERWSARLAARVRAKPRAAVPPEALQTAARSLRRPSRIAS